MQAKEASVCRARVGNKLRLVYFIWIRPVSAAIEKPYEQTRKIPVHDLSHDPRHGQFFRSHSWGDNLETARPSGLCLRGEILQELCGDGLARPSDLQGADQGRRIGNLQSQC